MTRQSIAWKTIGINVVLKTEITNSVLTDLGQHGKIRDILYEIRGSAAQVESILETSATPLLAGCRTVPLEGQVCWGADATGAGLLNADAALAATP